MTIGAIKYSPGDVIPDHLLKIAAIDYAESDTIPDHLKKMAVVSQAHLLKTGQTTVYVAGDDGDYQKGIAKTYTVLSTGAQTGTTNVDVPSYAAATISFTAATKTIADSGNGLATFKTGDTIVIRGSTSNNGVYTVATGNVAGSIVTTEALVDEAAAATISICKRVAPSNNTVQDNNTGLMWLRYGTSGPVLKVGLASDGKMCWNDTAYHFTLHAAAADLQIIAASKTLRIVGGSAESTRYNVGDAIVCAGFANAVNNVTGYVIRSVTVNGADLDIVLNVFNATLVNEAAAGSRSIKLVCQSIYAYCAAANAASLAGYTDWRIPTEIAVKTLTDMEAANAYPDSTAFPSFPTNGVIWSSTTRPDSTDRAMQIPFAYGGVDQALKTATNTPSCMLVRGGV